jgi:hypothetical protein
MSVIIISAILLVVAAAGSLNGFTTRFTLVDDESKQRSEAAVDACADIILSRLASDSTYAGPETVAVGTDSCRVVGAVNPGGSPRIFKVQAIISRAYTDTLITFDTGTPALTLWQEVGHF